MNKNNKKVNYYFVNIKLFIKLFCSAFGADSSFDDCCCCFLLMEITIKIVKFGTPKSNFHDCPKNVTVLFYIALMLLKDADGMVNTVDPDQTAP